MESKVKIRFRGKEYEFRVDDDPALVRRAVKRVQGMVDASDKELLGDTPQILLALLLELAVEEARLREGVERLLRAMEVAE